MRLSALEEVQWKKKRVDSLGVVANFEEEEFFLVVSKGSVVCEGSKMAVATLEKQQEVQ